MRRYVWLIALLVIGCGHAPDDLVASRSMHAANRPYAGETVDHVVILEMENRSFDHYFGTYPGANGLPTHPPCVPDPESGRCVYPFHDVSPVNYGGPHSSTAEVTDLDGGKMDGFVAAAEGPKKPQPDPKPDEVMGYHTCADIPYYCQLAANGVLADNAFAATSSWSTMAHLYLVSGWSASCSIPGDPMSCVSNNNINAKTNPPPDYAWTDITWLLHQNGISWGYYVYLGGDPFTLRGDGDDEMPSPTNKLSMSPWNPLPAFDDVRIDGQTANVRLGPNFETQARAGLLPTVSWVIPMFLNSDHPTASISSGQAWVEAQVNAVEGGPDAASTLIILNWDEWGGFYDHVVPPVVDGNGYGFRVPLILYGPMVKAGTIDHQMLSSDAYLKFIEDRFMGGARIDSTDGRPDSRPDVREDTPGLGDIANDLND